MAKKIVYKKALFHGGKKDHRISFPENVTFKSWKSAYECHGGNLEKEYERLTGRKAPNGSTDKTEPKSPEVKSPGDRKGSDKEK